MREYNHKFMVRLSDDDLEKIKKRMKEAGVVNMSAYFRKMALNGLIVNLDLSDLKETTRLLRINANNLNQYAKRANETDSIYLEDIKENQEQLEVIWQHIEKIWDVISTLR